MMTASSPRPLPRHGRRTPITMIEALLALSGEDAMMLQHTEASWQSATFHGRRFSATLNWAGDEAVARGAAFLDALPGHEFRIRGTDVVDAEVVWRQTSAVPASMTANVALLLLDE